MNFEIFVPLTLSQAQTFLAFVLSALGIGWFFLLSTAIRYNAKRRMLRTNKVPVLDTILPAGIIDIFNLLYIKRTAMTVITCFLVILGLLLTNFDSIIVVNSISYNELCKTDIVTTQAYITVDIFAVADVSYAETDAMLQKRNKSGIPSGVLVGQLPIDSRWRFDENFDVNPYPWRSSCSVHVIGKTYVHMNSSVMYKEQYQYQAINLSEMLPEVHAKYIFRDAPYGYNYTRSSFQSYTHFNSSSKDAVEKTATGTLILIIEEFTKGNVSYIGASVIHRLWTLRVPEENRMPYHRDDTSRTEILLVPMVVKAYSCEVTRVKDGGKGSVNILGDIAVAIKTSGDLIGRKYLTAQIKGTDDTILEYTPEYWASYMEVRDTMIANVSDVQARINIPCISIHPIYILLVSVYTMFILIGFLLWTKLYRDIPSSIVGWVVHACKESNLNSVNEAEFRRNSNEEVRIFQKVGYNTQWELTRKDFYQWDYPIPLQYPNSVQHISETYYMNNDEKLTSQYYYSQTALGSTIPNTSNT